MDDISIAELLRQNNVGSWVEMAENIHPGFRTELVCLGGPKDGRMTATYRNDVGRVLVTYARLRDWEIRVECKPLETWVRSNVSAANVEHAFRKARRPETILSDGEVLDWLAKASAVNDEFCKQIRFAMLRRGADDPPTEAQLQALQTKYTSMASTLGRECVKVAGFLGSVMVGRGGSETGVVASDRPKKRKAARKGKRNVVVEGRAPRQRTSAPNAPTEDLELAREMNRAGVERGRMREHRRLFASVVRVTREDL